MDVMADDRHQARERAPTDEEAATIEGLYQLFDEAVGDDKQRFIFLLTVFLVTALEDRVEPEHYKHVLDSFVRSVAANLGISEN